MKILNYDADVDILTIKFGGDVFESDELEPGIIVDYDTDGAVVAIEVMDLSKRIEKPSVATASRKTIAYPKESSKIGNASSAKPHRTAASRGSQEKKAKPRSKS